MDPLLLGIDLGTTAIKAALFGFDGSIQGLAYLEYPLTRPAPLHVEQDARAWWELTKTAVRNALSQKGVSASQVQAVGVSAQGISFVPVDNNARPLDNALTWLDTRAIEQAHRLQKMFPQAEAFRKLGIVFNPVYTLTKILWLKENEPEVFERAYKFSTAQDFLMARLVGEFITDHSIAGGTLMHDVIQLCWSSDMLQATGVPREKLPDIAWAGTPLGKIRPTAAQELGLSAEVEVVLGGHDQECAALGAGLRQKDVSISLGTASILIAPLKGPAFDPRMRIPCYPSVERDKWVLEAVVSTAGVSLRWLRDLFQEVINRQQGVRTQVDYESMIALAETIPPGCDGVWFFPHLSGATSPFWNPGATGVFYGISLSTSKAELVRAVLEGWVFQLKSNLLIIEELVGRCDRVIIFGGGARSSFIQQLIANVLDRPVAVSATPETALLGAAILAGTGAGFFDNVEVAKAAVCVFGLTMEPQLEAVERYCSIYERYRQVENHLLAIGEEFTRQHGVE
jgi:D-xylulose kinase